MGFLSRKKGRKISKFSAVIAIIGATISACEKKLPKEESNYFSKLGYSVQVQLEKGNIDENKIREFIRLYTQIKKNTNLKVFVPPKLEKGIFSLNLYYNHYENNTETFGQDKFKIEDIARMIVPNNAKDTCRDLVIRLSNAEKDLGIKLPEERKQLREFLKFIIRAFEYRISLIESGMITPEAYYDEKKRIEEYIKWLNTNIKEELS